MITNMMVKNLINYILSKSECTYHSATQYTINNDGSIDMPFSLNYIKSLIFNSIQNL